MLLKPNTLPGYVGYIVSDTIKLRRDHVVLRRKHFFIGQTIPGTDSTDIVWLNPDGTPRRTSDWSAADEGFLGFMISGEAGDGLHGSVLSRTPARSTGEKTTLLNEKNDGPRRRG